MFMALSSWQSYCESSPVHLMNAEQTASSGRRAFGPTQSAWAAIAPIAASTAKCRLFLNAAEALRCQTEIILWMVGWVPPTA